MVDRPSMPPPGPGGLTSYFGDEPIGPEEGRQIATQEFRRLSELYQSLPPGRERDAVGQKLDELMRVISDTTLHNRAALDYESQARDQFANAQIPTSDPMEKMLRGNETIGAFERNENPIPLKLEPNWDRMFRQRSR